MLSVLSSAVKMIGAGLVISDDREEDGVGPRDDFLRTETFAKGESKSAGILVRRGLGLGPESVRVRTDPLERCAMRLMMVGVEGAEAGAREELDEDAEDGGRVMVAAAGLAGLLCLGRVGDERRVGDVVRDAFAFGVFLSGVDGEDGLTLMADVRFTCSALRCGRGLIARVVFSPDLGRSRSIGLPFSSFCSSEVLRRRRVPARAGGDGPRFSFALSIYKDLGLYFGSAEVVVRELRGRRVDARFALILGLIVLGDDCSSEEVPPLGLGKPESLRVFFVTLLASGEAVFSRLTVAALSADGGPGGTRLLRFDTVLSFVFFPFSFSPAESLCIASARALPMEEKLRDFNEARVMGLLRCGSPVASVGIVVVVVVRVYRSGSSSERRVCERVYRVFGPRLRWT